MMQGSASPTHVVLPPTAPQPDALRCRWAEVLSADAFNAFEEAGLDDEDAVRATGRRFRDTVLALGGSVAPAEVRTLSVRLLSVPHLPPATPQGRVLLPVRSQRSTACCVVIGEPVGLGGIGLRGVRCRIPPTLIGRRCSRPSAAGILARRPC